MKSRYKLLIKGRNPNYFLDKIIRMNISIYDLEKKDNYIVIVVSEDGYQDINKLKTSYKIEVINRYGPAKIEYLSKKYLIFLVACLFGIIINLVLSNMIFDVEVVHSNKYIRELVKNDLDEAGIKKFRFKVSYDKKEKIVDDILKRETNDLEWLEIEEIGTKYVVKVEQRKKNKEVKECPMRNIVAKKDAMIISIEAEEGEVVRKKLDYVKRGDVIISGLIYNKEEIVSKRCARGTVYGEVWYKVNLELPKKYYEENVTGKKKNQLEINIFNKSYSFFNHFKTYKKESISILKPTFLPISLDFSKYLETEVITESYNLNNVSSKALEIASNRLKNKLGKKDKIISKKVLKKLEKDSKIVVDVFIKVKEDITDTESIEDINIEEENNKNSEE